MNSFRRVILIVLDGVGVGALPDSSDYGDESAATLPHVAVAVGGLNLPTLQRFGVGNICQIEGVSPHPHPAACWGKMAARSAGKDSITGHWELAGHVRTEPFACFPEGFPSDIIHKFSLLAGSEPLGNVAASGTDILRLLGEEHLAAKRPIVYTSSDSVFQVAAHEDIMPPGQLYQLCKQSLEMLRPYGVCRVIARPFVGDSADNFKRTPRRLDFPVEPASETILDLLQLAKVPTCGVGKISDLFAGRGLDQSYPTKNNSEGMAATVQVLNREKQGLIFVNLVDFDMLYGHRLDAEGFAVALQEFDRQLPQILRLMTPQDLLLITADHGCDPTTIGTDHCREYVPLLAWSPRIEAGMSLGVRSSFADVAATVADIFSIEQSYGKSFLADLKVLNG